MYIFSYYIYRIYHTYIDNKFQIIQFYNLIINKFVPVTSVW